MFIFEKCIKLSNNKKCIYVYDWLCFIYNFFIVKNVKIRFFLIVLIIYDKFLCKKLCM